MSDETAQGPRSLSKRASASLMLLLAIVAAGATTGTAHATSVSLVPSFSSRFLGEGATLSASLTFSGTELDNTAPPLTRIVLELPQGTTWSGAGFPTCPAETLERSGPSACPEGSMAGSAGSVKYTFELAGSVIEEDGTLQPVFGPSEELLVYFDAVSPVSIQRVSIGRYLLNATPSGSALEIPFPLIPTLPEASDASVAELSIGLGASRREAARKASSLRVPESCPPTGRFTWAADATFEGGGTAEISTETACPPAKRTMIRRIGPRPPVAGKSETVGVVSGTVLVRAKGATGFVPLSGADTLPNGSEVEASHGRVLITAAAPHGSGEAQSAEVYEGRFTIHQDHTGNGETHLILSQPLTGCRDASSADGSAAARAGRHRTGAKNRQLWVSEHGGSWGTNGRYVSTSVEGTSWLTIDECDRSTVEVAKGRVKVRDLVNHKARILSAGQRFTARAKRG